MKKKIFCPETLLNLLDIKIKKYQVSYYTDHEFLFLQELKLLFSYVRDLADDEGEYKIRRISYKEIKPLLGCNYNDEFTEFNGDYIKLVLKSYDWMDKKYDLLLFIPSDKDIANLGNENPFSCYSA